MSVFKRWNGTQWETIGPGISSARFENINNMIAPEFDPKNTYNIGDYVVQSDKLYRCINRIGTPQSWYSGNWREVKLGQDVTELRNDVVVVSDTQPTSENNRIWVKPDNNDMKIPLVEDVMMLPNSNDYGENGQYPRSTGNSIEWVDYGLPSDQQTENAINAWLDVHPEATTTVQDGSITESKLNNTIKPFIFREYVTPEMFGAVGDGTTDDTLAMQAAFDSDLPVHTSRGKVYLITNFIKLNKAKELDLNGAIRYNGSGFAIIINDNYLNVEFKDLTLNFGVIVCPNGSGVKINVGNTDQSTMSGKKYIAGVKFIGSYFYCKNTGIEVNAYYWFNENYFENFDFNLCQNAILITCYGIYGQAESIKFFKCHFEGITNGVHVISNGKDVDNYRFYGCRMYEPPFGKYILFEGIPENRIYAEMCFIYDNINYNYIEGVLACVYGSYLYSSGGASEPKAYFYVYNGKALSESLFANRSSSVIVNASNPEITMNSYNCRLYIPESTTGNTFIVTMLPETEGVYLDINRQIIVTSWQRNNTLRIIINEQTYNFSLAGKSEHILNFNFANGWACLM